MTERVIDRMMEMAGQLREQAAEAETIGRLTDQTSEAMKAAGNAMARANRRARLFIRLKRPEITHP